MPVFFEGDPGYEDVIATWNTLSQPRPLVVVQPKDAREVQLVVQTANNFNISPIAIRGCGHSFEGLGLGGLDGAIVIDTINMNSVSVGQDETILVAGGAAMLGKLALHAWKHGQRMIPMGLCPTVGIAGHAQSGGYGFQSRTYGTTTDHVSSFEVVTADGEIRHVSDRENQELFYALRGSGTGSFGVITSVTLRTIPAPTAVANYSLKWRLDDHDIPRILNQLQHSCLAAPLQVSSMIIVWLGVLQVFGSIFADSASERDMMWKDFKFSLPTADEGMFNPTTYIESVKEIALTQTSAPWVDDFSTMQREGREHLRYMKIKAGFLPNEMSEELLNELGTLMVTQPRTGVRVQILTLNPNYLNYPERTSVKNRGCHWLMGMSVWLQVREHGLDGVVTKGDERRPWLTRAYELFYPHTNGGYTGDDDREEWSNGRNGFDSYFGDYLPLLSRIKAKYDPKNMFRHPLSIPLPELLDSK